MPIPNLARETDTTDACDVSGSCDLSSREGEGGRELVLREVKGLCRLWRKGQRRAKKAEGRAQCHGVQPLEQPGLSACFLLVVVGGGGGQVRGWRERRSLLS